MRSRNYTGHTSMGLMHLIYGRHMGNMLRCFRSISTRYTMTAARFVSVLMISYVVWGRGKANETH